MLGSSTRARYLYLFLWGPRLLFNALHFRLVGRRSSRQQTEEDIEVRPTVLSQPTGSGKYTQDDGTLDIAESAQDWLLNRIEHNFSGGHRLVAAHFTNSETWQVRLRPVHDFVNDGNWRSDCAIPRWLRICNVAFGRLRAKGNRRLLDVVALQASKILRGMERYVGSLEQGRGKFELPGRAELEPQHPWLDQIYISPTESQMSRVKEGNFLGTRGRKLSLNLAITEYAQRRRFHPLGRWRYYFERQSSIN